MEERNQNASAADNQIQKEQKSSAVANGVSAAANRASVERGASAAVNGASVGRRTSTAASGTKKKKRKDSQLGQMIRFVVILVLVAGVIIAVYLRMTNQSKNSAQKAEENLTETEILKLYDLDNKYPKAARDVVKMHCRMLKTTYNEKLSDDDYTVLNMQMRKLFSEALLAQNDPETQLEELKRTTKEFRTDGKIYISYSVDQEANVQYSTVDGVEYALVLMNCTIKQSSGTNTLSEEYLLCKEDGKWKIVGWQGLASEHTIEEQK